MKLDFEDIITAIILLGFILIILLFIGYVITSSHESISVKALDNVCKELVNDTNASYYPEFGRQRRFTCRTGDKIYVIEEIVEA